MQPAIRAQGLTRRFGNFTAVNGLDLCVDRGEVFGFLGPNGAGKTTTVRLLNGILAASAGKAEVLGLDVALSPNEVRRQSGVLTETPSLYEALTARENLTLFGELYDVPADALPRRVEHILEEFGLRDRASEPVGAFSKGMKQRLAIARALLHEPPLIYLDEPTASLDPEAARMVMGVIEDLSQHEGRTVFLCTHNLAEAQRLCDRVGVIGGGVLQAVGTPAELARSLWDNVWVELDLHDTLAPEVRQALDRAPFVRSQTVEEGKLVLEMDNEDDIPDLVAIIANVGGRIYGVAARQHTLEEIYFKIQGDGRNSHASAAGGGQ
ncbi:MAG: ABC transporter ATP-binding protein [Anaerolineae bacterium]